MLTSITGNILVSIMEKVSVEGLTVEPNIAKIMVQGIMEGMIAMEAQEVMQEVEFMEDAMVTVEEEEEAVTEEEEVAAVVEAVVVEAEEVAEEHDFSRLSFALVFCTLIKTSC